MIRAALLTLLAVLVASPASAWLVAIDGTAPESNAPYLDWPDERAGAVAVDPVGDVVGGGVVVDAGVSGKHLIAVKLAGRDGATRWRTDVAESGIVFSGLTFDAAGDAIGTAAYYPLLTDFQFNWLVVKLAGATGAELWRVDGIPGSTALAFYAVFPGPPSVDAAGDVVVAGVSEPVGMDRDCLVVKLDGTTGQELWRTALDGTRTLPYSSYAQGDWCRARLDPAGDVLVAGTLDNAGTGLDFLVAKLAGASGAELWRREIDVGAISVGASALDVTPSGDVVAGGAGYLTKLRGTDGATLWNVAEEHILATFLALDPTGDVLLNGDTANGSRIFKRRGSDGALLWQDTVFYPGGHFLTGLAVDAHGNASTIRLGVAEHGWDVRELSGANGSASWIRNVEGSTVPNDVPLGIALGPDDSVAVAGRLANLRTQNDFVVAKLSTAVAGASLRVSDEAGDPTRRRLRLVAHNFDGIVPAPGGPADPTGSGASLELANPATSQSVTFALPAGSWTGTGAPPGSRAYEYRDDALANGPCSRVVIKAASRKRALMALCRGDGIGFSLDEPSQGSLRLTLRGGPITYCAEFGGTVAVDRPAAGSVTGLFIARAAPAPDACP